MNPSRQILLKARCAAIINARAGLARLAGSLPVTVEACYAALKDSELYCYLGATGEALENAAGLEQQARQILGDPASTASVIEPLIHVDGPGRGTVPAYHYVVETDVEPANEQGLNDWYNIEHLPGLAAVPGCIAAARFRNDSHPPRYIACYDLASTDVLERPEWLAVRHTEWSSRVRPDFRNTKRTMFRRLT